MPSLSALREFKASFDDIGGQKADLEAKNIPFDNLEFPGVEPEPLNLTEPPEADSAAEASEAGIPETDEADSAEAPLGGNLDFSAFLDANPDNLPPPPSGDDLLNGDDSSGFDDDSAGIDLSAGEEIESPDTGAGDFDVPDGLLSGLAEELDSAPPDFSEEPATGEAIDLGGEDFDLGEIPGFDEPDASPEPDDAAGENPLSEGLDDIGFGDGDAGDAIDLGGENIDLGGELSGSEDFDLGDVPDFGTPDDAATQGVSPGDDLGDIDFGDEAAGDGTDSGGEDFDLGDMSDLNIPGDSPEAAEPSADELLAEDFDDIDFGDGEAGDTVGEADGIAGDAIDLGGENIDLDGEGGGGEDFDLGEIPDFGASDDSGEPGAEPDGGGGDAPDSDAENPDFEDDASGIDLGGEAFDTGLSSPGDSFDSFNLTGDGSDDAGESSASGGDDFSLPGLDDLLSDAEEKKPGAAKGKGKTQGKGKAKEPSRDFEDGEILLTDEDLDVFKKTLAGYPLNLRLACEEIIAEQLIAPELMARLVRMLVRGSPARETAALAGEILDKTITIPKGFEKSTGEALEVEQGTFAYIFVHNFLPILRLFAFVAAVAASTFYLAHQFIYTPLKAESIYKIGYERIFAGEYQRANERFSEAFGIHRKKDWFYKYAEAFRDERQYMYAEQKYDEMLRYYPRDKKAVLDYAGLETHYLRNYPKAESLLRNELLDYAPNDPEGLLALGDNSLAWGEIEPAKYEDARYNYARLLELYGWTDPVVERMMKYFIRTDNLKEVLPLKDWFDSSPKRNLSAESMSELGGYLLDKQLEKTNGVPNEHVEYITGVRDLLLKSVMANPSLPEGHYHLARYYHNLGNTHEERVTLQLAIRAFDNAREESLRRLNYRIDAHQRYADVLINAREFIPAEEQLVKGVNLYEDALNRRLMPRTPAYGKLYAGLGDLEYFTKIGDMETTLGYYHRAEQNGWSPPEMQYRMGAAYYQLEDWKNALEYFFTASANLPLNRRLLFSLGNASCKRGDYFAAQGYYNRLLDILEAQRSRLPVLLPNDRPEYLELAERLMMARNNAAVAYEALANQTGDRRYRTRALALYAEANRAWDARTRDPRTMIRSSSTPLPFLNSRNALYPQPGYEPQLFIRIDRDIQDPPVWEQLAPLVTD
jgi:tetratricopeptide (TPR) repeat protein